MSCEDSTTLAIQTLDRLGVAQAYNSKNLLRAIQGRDPELYRVIKLAHTSPTYADFAAACRTPDGAWISSYLGYAHMDTQALSKMIAGGQAFLADTHTLQPDTRRALARAYSQMAVVRAWLAHGAQHDGDQPPQERFFETARQLYAGLAQ